jgi:hypothetical protein
MEPTRAAAEEKGCVAVVMNGLRPIPAAALKKVQDLAPGTDPAGVLVLDRQVKPIPAAVMEQRLGRSRVAVVAGGGLLLLAVLWALAVSRRLHALAVEAVS